MIVTAGSETLNHVIALAGGRFLAVGSRSTALLSSDGGLHWQHHAVAEDPWDLLSVAQAPSGRIYALACQELFSSVDGAAWLDVTSYPANSDFPYASNRLYIAGDGKLYICATDYNTKSDQSRSWVSRSDDGVVWSPIHYSDEYASFGPIVAFADGELLVGNDARLERRAGADWIQRNLPFSNVSELRIDGDELWAASQGSPGGVFVSRDRGKSWTRRYEAEASMSALCVSGATVCAAGGRTLALSRDRGESWTAHESPQRLRSVAAVDGGSVVAVGDDGTVLLVPAG